MNKIIACLVFTLIPSMTYALTWCQWSGSAATNCKSTIKQTIVIGGNEVNVDEETLNPLGWYIMNTTHPAIGPDQVQDSIVWSFENNQIGRTWTVRDLTQAEIDARDAKPLDLTMYYLLKGLMQLEVFTIQQAASFFPPETIAAYQARNRLENP